MNIGKLLMRDSLIGYSDYMMDNSCKGLDGSIYRSINKPSDLSINALHDMDIDYAILIWTDFADSHSRDYVVLKDRDV